MFEETFWPQKFNQGMGKWPTSPGSELSLGWKIDIKRFPDKSRDETSQEHKIQGWLETIICILNMKQSNSRAGLKAEKLCYRKAQQYDIERAPNYYHMILKFL